jgi:hypothetical protein
MAATMSQPDKPKKYVNIRSEELQIYPREENGCARIKSPATRINKDKMINNKGILLKLVIHVYSMLMDIVLIPDVGCSHILKSPSL